MVKVSNKKYKKKSKIEMDQSGILINSDHYVYRNKNGRVECGRCGTSVFIGNLVEYRCPRCLLLVWLDPSIRGNKSYSTGAD